MSVLGASPDQVRLTGGGARSAFWRRLVADLLGRPVVRNVVDEGPAHGAALLAGVTSGVFASVKEARAGIQLRSDVCEPNAAQRRRYDD